MLVIVMAAVRGAICPNAGADRPDVGKVHIFQGLEVVHHRLNILQPAFPVKGLAAAFAAAEGKGQHVEGG